MASTVFSNAPLVEMIAEMRWDLFPVQTAPGAGIDPFHDVTKKQLVPLLARAGYSMQEDLVPPEVPKELLGGQATARFRIGRNQWPLFQLGPGVFSVNMTTSYTGWASFRPILELGLTALFEAHPAPESMLKINTLRLIAVDAFGPSHGYANYSEFTKKYLGLDGILPNDYVKQFTKDFSAVTVRSETHLPLNKPEGAIASVSIGEGLRDKEKALIMQTAIEQQGASEAKSAILMGWFDAAHQVHHAMFNAMLTDGLRDLLHPRVSK